MQKIIITVPQLPLHLDSIKGGVHSALINLLNGFAQLPISIRVVSFSTEVNVEQIVSFSDSIFIHHVPEGNSGSHLINYLRNGKKIMQKQIADFNPDLIHFQECNSFFLIKPFSFPRSKTLVTIHGFALEEAKRKKKIKDKITWLINGWLNPLLMPKNIIHLSKFSTTKFNSKKVTHDVIIPNAIKNIFFDIPQKDKTDNRLLYLGVIDNNKNLIFTLELLSKLIEQKIYYNLDVLGGFSNDDYEKQIRSYIKEKNLTNYVHFHGWVNQSYVLNQLEKSDILLVSSKHESLQMAIAESMAAGKVVLASNVGGIPEMFENNVSGFLFDLNNIELPLDILIKLYNNNEMIKSISANARRQALEKFHCKNVAKETIDFYNLIPN
jgi:glycosyltransferase involved in cell wall biosynthesis